MEKILWFDLEETMIESWEKPAIINFLKIEKIIKTEKPDKLIKQQGIYYEHV